MNLAFQIFNIPGINEERDLNTSRIYSSLELPSLGSLTMTSQDPCDLAFSKEFKPGEVGLWNSTYEALKKFVHYSDFDALLILEDDALLHPGFLAGALEYLDRVPMLWDFFYQYVHPWQGANNFTTSHEIGDSKICRSYQVWSNACFWVSRKGATRLLEAVAEPIDDAVDWYILKRGMTKEWDVYTLKPGVPMFCNIAGFETTIQNG